MNLNLEYNQHKFLMNTKYNKHIFYALVAYLSFLPSVFALGKTEKSEESERTSE